MKKLLIALLSTVSLASFAQLEFSGVDKLQSPFGTILVLEDLFNTVLWQGEFNPTATDYVQDGLIAHYDGIENVEYGTHDSTATVWSDLMGGNDLSLKSLGSFEADCLYGQSSSSVGVVANGGQLSNLGYGTVEVVLQQTGYNAYDSLYFFYGGPYLTIGRRNAWIVNGLATINRRNYAATSSVAPDFRVRKSVTVLHRTSDTSDFGEIYVNGSPVAVTKQSASVVDAPATASIATKRYATRFYCIRVYNRGLTTTEIAWTYSIDKIRFNLP